MTSGDRDDFLFLYAAGALEGAERDEVEEWLASGAPDAQADVARAEQEVALLAAAQAPVAPSAAVRERLAARVARSGGVRALRAPVPPAGRRLHPALAACLGGLLAAGVAGVVAHRVASDAGRAQQAVLREEIAGLQEEIADVKSERDELETDLSDTEARLRTLESDLVLAQKTIGVLQADHAESLVLAGTAQAPEARGRVYWDWDEWYCYARVSGLAKETERVYAIWLFTEDGVIGVGTFHSRADGTANFLGPVPHDVGHVLRAGVSIEPDEALGAKPRGEVVMLGEAAPGKSG